MIAEILPVAESEDDLDKWLATLPTKQRFMLGMAVSALSLRKGQCRTRGDLVCFITAAGLPITRQAIEQIEGRALRKCRRTSLAHGEGACDNKMSEENKQPKSAFPVYAKDDGMALRDWFAGMALQGRITTLVSHELIDNNTLEHVATWSYLMADAMMKEREKRQ